MKPKNNTPEQALDKPTNTDSTTQVVWRTSEPRGNCTYKGNKELWKAFVSYCRLNFGSVCHVLEPIEVALMTKQVVQSSTIRPLVIENMTVERAVKRVRRYAVENEWDEANGCYYCEGRRPAVGQFRHIPSGKIYGLCEFHARDLLDQTSTKGSRVKVWEPVAMDKNEL